MTKNSNSQIEKLQNDMQAIQAKIDKINSEFMAVKSKLFDVILKENDDENLRNIVRNSAKKLSKSEQKKLAKIFEWL